MAWNQEKLTRTGLRVQMIHSSVLSHMSSSWVYWTKWVEYKMFKINIFSVHYTMYHISLYHSKHILEMIKKLKSGRRSHSLVKVMVQRSVDLFFLCFDHAWIQSMWTMQVLQGQWQHVDDLIHFLIQNKTQSQNKPRSSCLVIHCCLNDCSCVFDAAENHIKSCSFKYANTINLG